MSDTLRPAPDALETMFRSARAVPSDINEHLDLLRQLAAECEHVTEFGLRWANGSTIALLAGQPAQFISYDINPHSIVQQSVLNLLQMQGRTRFQPRCGSTLEVTIEKTELLFVDSLHTAEQLKAELIRHADPMRNTVTRYLVFHDTATFGLVGEDGKTPGLREVIRWYQKCHAFPQWRAIEDRKNNNGLVVLERVRP